MDVRACPDCTDAHAERIVSMYDDLETPLDDIRGADDKGTARKILEKWLGDAVKLGFFKEHGKIRIEIDDDVLHILDKDDQKMCKK